MSDKIKQIGALAGAVVAVGAAAYGIARACIGLVEAARGAATFSDDVNIVKATATKLNAEARRAEAQAAMAEYELAEKKQRNSIPPSHARPVLDMPSLSSGSRQFSTPEND